jgi:hypothetical protein
VWDAGRDFYLWYLTLSYQKIMNQEYRQHNRVEVYDQDAWVQGYVTDIWGEGNVDVEIQRANWDRAKYPWCSGMPWIVVTVLKKDLNSKLRHVRGNAPAIDADLSRYFV